MSASSACERSPEAVIVPEFEFTYSFSGGLAGWTPAAADIGTGSWSATESSGALRLELVNASGAGKAWLTHELEVTPDKAYAVVIEFDLATADHDAAQAWKLIAGAGPKPPVTVAELPFQDGTSSGGPAGETVWVKRAYAGAVQPDEEGKLYLTLGIWGTTTGSRSYLIDNVKVVLTRTE